MITTITIPSEIKKELEKLKGNKTWAEFLKELIEIYKEYRKMKIREAIKRLKETFTKEELEELEKRVMEWRKNFKLRELEL